MKKLFSLILVAMLFVFAGCSSKANFELVEMTNEQKALTMQAMEMPEYEGLTISLEVNLENKAKPTEKIYIKASSYTNLKNDALYLEYLDAEFDVNIPEFNMLGKAELFIKGNKAYLSTDASTKKAAANVTYKSKEVMTLPETIKATDIIDMLNEFTLVDKGAAPTASELEEMAAFLNVMKIYQDGNKTKLEVIITKQIILDLMASDNGIATEYPFGEDLPNDMGDILLDSLGDDTSITLVINMENNIMKSMSIEAILSISNDEINLTGSLVFKMDLNGKAPKTPKDSVLEEYEPVLFFSILGSTNELFG